MAPLIPSARGVSSSRAPKASIARRRSTENESGMQRMIGYPFTAATIASPMPVFPEVGSTMVPPGASTPRRSASSTIARAIRSLMLPPGFARSSFIHTSAGGPNSRLMRTCGVRPMVWRMV